MKYKLPILLFSLALPALGFAQINDDCNNAVVFPALNAGTWTEISSGETIEGATQSLPPIQNCTGYTSSEAKDVWFKFQAISSKHTIKVTPTVFRTQGSIDPIIGIYSSCGSACLACMDMGGGDGWEETLTYENFTVGANYYIRVYHYNPNLANPSSFNDFSIKIYTQNSSGASDISFSPTSLNFGTVLVDGGASTLTINVTNEGNQLLTVNNINSQNNSFSTYPSNLSISPGQTESVEVNFNPSSATTYNSNIEFVSNAPGSPHSFFVAGTGTNAPAAQISVTPSSLPFGAVAQNSTAPTMEFIISNTGNAPLSVTSISAPVGYIISWSMGQILPGANQSVFLTLQTADIGAFGGTITINSNAGNLASLIVSGSVVQSTNFITGSVKDISGTTTSGTGLIDNSSIGSGRTVELYNSSNQLVGSTTTNSAGVFNFMNVANGNYNVLAKANLNSGQSNVRKTNVPMGASITIKSPKTLLNKLDALSNELASIKVEIDGIVKQTNGFNTINIDNSIDNYHTLTDNYQQASIVLGRLYEIATMINELSKDANEMSVESSTTIYLIGKLLLSEMEAIKIFQLCVLPNYPTAFAVPLNWLSEEIIDLLDSAGDWIIEHSINLLPMSIRGETKAFFEMSKSIALSMLSGSCAEVTEFFLNHDNYLKNNLLAYTGKVRMNTYLSKTQSSLDEVAIECANTSATFSTPLPSIVSQVNNINLDWSVSTDLKAIAVEQKRDNAEIAEQTSDALDLASDLAGTLPSLATVKTILEALEVISKAMNALFLGQALGISEKQINDIHQAVKANTTSLLLTPPIKPTDFYSQTIIQNNLQNLDSINTEFINFLDTLLEDIDYSRDFKAISRVARYRQLNLLLNEAIKMNLYPIYAITEQALANNPNFENLYNTQLLNSITQSSQLRSAFSSNLIRYILDTTDVTTSNSVVTFGQTLKNTQLLLPVTITQFTNLTSQYQAPAFPVIYSTKYSRLMGNGTAQIGKIFLGNFGALDATGVTIQIKAHGGFWSSIDSLYLGTLPMNGTDSVEFVINAPSLDTIGGFEIILNDANSNSYGAGMGIRTVEQLPTSTQIEVPTHSLDVLVKIAPNPVKDFLTVSYFMQERDNIVFSVYDTRGSLVDKYSINNAQVGENTLFVNSQNFTEGLYFLNIKTKDSNHCLKFFVNKQID